MGEKTLEELICQLDVVIKPVCEWEAVLIYDCGTDNSWKIIEMLKKRFPANIIGIKLKRNFGQHISTLLAMNYVSGGIVVTLDEDLQYKPDDILPLVDNLVTGSTNLVYGIPRIQYHNKLKRTGSSLLKTVLKISKPQFQYDYSSFRVMDRELTKKVLISESPFFFIDAVLNDLNPTVFALPVNHYPRTTGCSSYTYSRLAKHALIIVLAYTGFLKKVLLAGYFLMTVVVSLFLVLLLHSKYLNIVLLSILIGLSFIIGVSHWLKIFFTKQTCSNLSKTHENYISTII